MLTENQKSHIKWACRRGMLELDVILMPFFEEQFDSLTQEEQKDFVRLLELDDPVLFSWLMGKTRSDNPQLATMIDKILEHNRSQLA
ncbi:MAG: succinate dehydrogenase assembly factor 2 [Lactobacillus panisapium]